MGLFRKKTMPVTNNLSAEQAALAETVLNSINDGVMIVDANGLVKLANPAAARMTGNSQPSDMLGLSFLSVLRLATGEGATLTDSQNPLAQAAVNNMEFSSRDFYLLSLQGEGIPIAISLVPSGGRSADRIITFRNIAEELEKESEQTEFISTASHEMRTPVASIEGYLGLALNPSTATIDERARKYLTEAHAASQHLGKLFQDLLDVTRLDDKREKVHLVPTEMTSAVKEIADRQFAAMANKQLTYTFGSNSGVDDKMQLGQLVYAMVDIDFLQEIMNNLIENAIKYTPEGGAIWVAVRGDGDNVLINVTDTGMGISPDNLTHIFQKFYRVDNSQTREIGGTGLGLYIVKERVEAMGGRVWAESTFSEGSTFYVSLPRISEEEYQRQLLVIQNTAAMPIGPAAGAGLTPTAASMSSGAILAAGNGTSQISTSGVQ
ncbi:PAS domain-containing protein [Candidatus Saccharibacteria bacterium]|nr:PAS domain-containing protein [Candidatus Saccharibacteria bacterium]